MKELQNIVAANWELKLMLVTFITVIIFLLVVIILMNKQITTLVNQMQRIEAKYQKREDEIKDTYKAKLYNLSVKNEDLEKEKRDFKAQRDYLLESRRNHKQ